MTKLFLDPFFQELWRGKDPFAEVAALSGELFRDVKNRRTSRVEIGGRGFFLKHHLGTGWGEIVMNLLQGKLPVLSAVNEFRALRKLHELGIPTMTPCACGERGIDPARRESFLITEELTNTVSLEDLCAQAPGPLPFRERLGLIAALAESARKLHDNGINHRDFYLCHFQLDLATRGTPHPVLYMMDLHRAQMRKRIPARYRVKDVAGLYFSSMDAGLTRRDYFRFMRLYRGKSLRETLTEERRFWHEVDVTARKLYAKEHGRPAPEF